MARQLVLENETSNSFLPETVYATFSRHIICCTQTKWYPFISVGCKVRKAVLPVVSCSLCQRWAALYTAKLRPLLSARSLVCLLYGRANVAILDMEIATINTAIVNCSKLTISHLPSPPTCVPAHVALLRSANPVNQAILQSFRTTFTNLALLAFVSNTQDLYEPVRRLLQTLQHLPTILRLYF